MVCAILLRRKGGSGVEGGVGIEVVGEVEAEAVPRVMRDCLIWALD